MKEQSVSFEFGKHTITLKTGKIARQATAAVMVEIDKDTQILVTVVAKKTADPKQEFFPLTVNYQERYYAVGRIPGGFNKREARPSEKETLTSRLIDRPIRPLFPEGFYNEVQVIATVLSLDGNINPDVPAVIGASAALALSGIPFKGPIGCSRVGYVNGEYIVNPTYDDLEQSDLDLVVAGTEHAVLMVESEANMLSEAVMLGAVMFGHKAFQNAIKAIQELTDLAGKKPWDWSPPTANTQLIDTIKRELATDLAAAYQIKDKIERTEKVSTLKKFIVEKLTTGETPAYTNTDVLKEFESLEKDIVRTRILSQLPRIDGRSPADIRTISVEVGNLPRVHGSALFTRGETQALVITTLGTERDGQLVDALEGEYREQFMLHYNFPPYCVGEVGFLSSPKRREIGHGRLAKRGIQAVLPASELFPYTIRVVSEITESNGSSSMASVCGTSLSLMDAGVPIQEAVAGIAMGLIKEGDKFAVLSDIMGDEDHLGDMDFKVAGTAKGINALQMDIKIDGITEEIMRVALEQAKQGRLHILGIMNQTIDKPREQVSQHAPRILNMKIDPDKIRDVIGKGGATIRSLTEETGAEIEIDQDGTVRIAAIDLAAGQEAMRKIELLTASVELGQIYTGQITKLMDFGAIVNILPGKDGLVHISQISHERVESIYDRLSEGETVTVKVIEIDRMGRVRLSMKEVSSEASAMDAC